MIGDQISIQIAVAIVVSEGHHYACAHGANTILQGTFDECSVALIDIQLIGTVVAANIQVKIPVIIDVDKGRTGGPGIFRALDSGPFCNVSKVEIPKVMEKLSAARGTGQKHVD